MQKAALLCVLALLIWIASPIDLAASTVEQAVDRNGNCIIEDSEITRAVEYWITGSPLPGTSGLTVGDAEILELVRLWITSECISLPPTPPPASVETAFLSLINQHRSQSTQCWNIFEQTWVSWPASAVRDLALSAELSGASVYHSQFMADRDCFAHQCPGEADLVARIEQAGYTGWWVVSENIAAGMETPEEAFEAWRSSPPHNRNMLNCDVREIGVGRVHDVQDQYPTPQTPYRWYWTTDFGRR